MKIVSHNHGPSFLNFGDRVIQAGAIASAEITLKGHVLLRLTTLKIVDGVCCSDSLRLIGEDAVDACRYFGLKRND